MSARRVPARATQDHRGASLKYAPGVGKTTVIRRVAAQLEGWRWVSQSYEDALFLPLPVRLAKRLLRLAETHGEPAGGTGTRIEFPLSQQELAKMAGVSREAVNKLLRAWQSEGLIAHDHSHVPILDVARLRRLIEPA